MFKDVHQSENNKAFYQTRQVNKVVALVAGDEFIKQKPSHVFSIFTKRSKHTVTMTKLVDEWRKLLAQKLRRMGVSFLIIVDDSFKFVWFVLFKTTQSNFFTTALCVFDNNLLFSFTTCTSSISGQVYCAKLSNKLQVMPNIMGKR